MNLREFFDRYGVSLGVLAILALVVALVPGNANSNRVASNGGPQSATRIGSAGAAGGTSGTGAVTGAGGVAGGATSGGGVGGVGAGAAQLLAGSDAIFGQGPHCRSDLRQVGITLYMPPCVLWNGGNNGGSTADGVTANKIVIIRWLGQVTAATRAILQANQLGDSPETIKAAYEALFNYSNYHYETYGREVVFEDYQASADSTNDEVMIADAQKIADKHPFAVIDGDPAAQPPSVFMRELNARGVLCVCSVSYSEKFYADNPHIIPGGLPDANEYCRSSAEYSGKRLIGNHPNGTPRFAEFAGDEFNPTQGYKTKPRVFGLMYLNGMSGVIEPDAENDHQACVDAFGQYGIHFAKEIGFNYNPGQNQSDLTNMIGQMKDAGVTTLIMLTDPLSPILLTTEATRQNYFPEWFVTGTGLSDTTTAGRLYDPKQWTHAFGQTPLWVTWTKRQNGPGYQEFHDARRSAADGSEGVLIEIYRANTQLIFRGIHMAGPNLTQDSFVQGLFNYPPTPAGGGTAALPYVYMTPQEPAEIKDFAEVFFDLTQTGPDERSEQGAGMMMKTDGGARHQIGQWPDDDPHIHRPGALAVSDTPPGGGNPPYTQGPAYPPNGCMDCS